MKLKWLSVLLPVFLLAGNTNEDIEFKLRKLKAEFDKKIHDLTQRIDENEFQASMNRIKWGGEFTTNWGFYKGKTQEGEFSNPNKWDMALKLNMEAFIDERTKFTGRLMMTKAWGSSNAENISALDALQGRARGTSALFVERAYVDYKFNNKLIFTIGRQPSSDGPGMDLKYDVSRQATYPALLFNGAADGLVMTYKLSIPKLRKTRFRLAYGKGYEWQDSAYGWSVANPGIKDTNVYGAFFEGALPYEKIGKNYFIFTAVKTTHLVTNPFDNKDAIANVDLGSYTHYGVFFENKHAFDTNFNYFISYAYAKPKSSGKVGMADLNNDGVADTEVELLKDSGYAYHIGARYDYLPYKIGYEFNHGSKYWFSFSTNLYDPMNKLAVRGDVHDGYLIYRIDLYEYFRFGITQAKIKYNFIGMYFAPNGEPQKVNDDLRVVYLTYNVRW